MDWLRNYARDRYEDGVELNDKGRVENKGLGGLFWQNFVDERAIKEAEQKSYNQQAARGQGENLADLNVGPNASTLDVQGAAISKERERNKAAGDLAHTRSMEPVQLEMAAMRGQNAITEKRLDNQFALQYQRGLSQDKATEQARLDDLQYRRAQDRREDLRYNENIARMERKDRKESLNTMITGLAQLGAAFAM